MRCSIHRVGDQCRMLQLGGLLYLGCQIVHIATHFGWLRYNGNAKLHPRHVGHYGMKLYLNCIDQKHFERRRETYGSART